MKNVLNVIKKILPDADYETSKDNCGNWDSATHLQIIMEIEETYNIEIPIEAMSKLTSVRAIKDYIDAI